MTIRLALVLIAGLNTIIVTTALGVEPDQQVSPTLTSDVASGPNSVTTSVAAAYDLARHWRGAIGYRHMAIHHDRERGDIDLALSGPIFGISYRF